MSKRRKGIKDMRRRKAAQNLREEVIREARRREKKATKIYEGTRE